ncbi:MAG TPA: glycosyltransferase family 4 protein [Candidatus Acidoferrum sp.]|nr:glycosyltransferase family 4 protein [Candidatus Acidoferrum sp.]
MRTAQVLRKYDPAEWGGTESAVTRMLEGLGEQGVQSVLFCPRQRNPPSQPLPLPHGCSIQFYRARVPVWGLSAQEKRQFACVGGNLFSFDLMGALWREQGVQLIHTHTLGRLGAIAARVALRRRAPFVVSIHGGFLDLPRRLKESFQRPERHGFDWGRLFGWLLASRRMLERADAILTCNPTEAARLREMFPAKRVQVQPHGVKMECYRADARNLALQKWPRLRGRRLLLCVGRVDAVKNQLWLVERVPELCRKHPGFMLVIAGPCSDEGYAEALQRRVDELGIAEAVTFTGGLPPGDPRLPGLYQLAGVAVLPSVSETFGLVLLEAWAAGAAVIASRTSGARALVQHGENGWLFDLERPETFHEAANVALNGCGAREQCATRGRAMVQAQYDLPVIARHTRQLYYQLIEAKSCAT